MAEVNQFGLSRDIPAEVKRRVRQRCGFGCVVCGLAIFQYDHMAVPYAGAREHNPEDITLLCASHHQEKTAGRLSLATVLRHHTNPYCKQVGHARGPFDIGPEFSELVLGTIICRQCTTIVEILGERVLHLDPPEEAGAPFRLNALLTDHAGAPVMQIVDNEWRAGAENWDVNVQGPEITIRRGIGDIALRIRIEPPNRIVFERLHMTHRGVTLDCAEGRNNLVQFGNRRIEVAGAEISGCRVALQVHAHGASVGVGGGSVRIGFMSVGPRTSHAGTSAAPTMLNAAKQPEQKAATTHPLLSREQVQRIAEKYLNGNRK